MFMVIKFDRFLRVYLIFILFRWEKGEWFRPQENVVRLKDENVN